MMFAHCTVATCWGDWSFLTQSLFVQNLYILWNYVWCVWFFMISWNRFIIVITHVVSLITVVGLKCIKPQPGYVSAHIKRWQSDIGQIPGHVTSSGNMLCELCGTIVQVQAIKWSRTVNHEWTWKRHVSPSASRYMNLWLWVYDDYVSLTFWLDQETKKTILQMQNVDVWYDDTFKFSNFQISNIYELWMMNIISNKIHQYYDSMKCESFSIKSHRISCLFICSFWELAIWSLKALK